MIRIPPAAAMALCGLVVGIASCDPIEARPLIDPPINTCPCDRFDETTTGTAARCSERNRCEILTPGGRPEYPFWIVVHVPDSSIFAPGSTFVLSAETAFKEPEQSTVIVTCRPSRGCVQLGGIVGVSGSYSVTSEVSARVGYPLTENTSIPVRVVYEQRGRERLAETDPIEIFPRLPLNPLFGASTLKGKRAEFSRALPVGSYERVFYPEPPFDELFPPRVDIRERVIPDLFGDQFILGADNQLDDPEGTAKTRLARVKRDAGLDGWRVWLEDTASHRRISVIRRLSGTESEVELFTVIGRSLGDDDVAVVAPPASWTGVPRYETDLFGGLGLQTLNYPPIPPPVAVAGVVAEPTSSTADPLFGYPARITFESTALATLTTDAAGTTDSPLLRYSTTLSTDSRGRFATVLPPGKYIATIEPAVGTGHAIKKEPFAVDRAFTTEIFQPPRLTEVKGRAVLADGRPLGGAEVIAIPDTTPRETPTSNDDAKRQLTAPVARPGRTRTRDDGSFSFELDPGSYFLSVIPTPGTGFPRVVLRTAIPSSPTELPDIRVPAPIRLAFELRHPRPTTPNFIKDAIVRVFAEPRVPGGGAIASDPVEIGSGMTDSEGKVEILLAQEPR